MNEELKRFVDHCGGYRKAAGELGVSPATVHCWVKGKHQIKPKYAERIQSLTQGRFDAAKIVFGSM